VVTIGGANHAGPREFDAQVAAHVVAFQLLTVLVNQHRLDAWERKHGETGDGGCNAGDWRDEDTPVLGLPPRIYDRCLPFADFLVIPIPRFFIDGLTHATQLMDAAQVFAVDVLVTGSHQRADGGRGGIEDIYLVLLHDIPKTPSVGPCGNSFKHQRGSSLR